MEHYFCQQEKHSNFDLAEKIPGKTTNIFCSLAKELKSNVSNGKTFQNLKDENNNLEFIPSDKKKLTESFISIGKSEELIGSLIYAKKNQLVGPVKTFRGYSLIIINEISDFDSTAWISQKDIILYI